MIRQKIRMYCPYCRVESEIVQITVREMPKDYKNPITGKNQAIIEKLSCGHEYVDNKFNVDNLYYSSKPSIEPIPNKQSQVVINDYKFYSTPKQKGLNVLDIACGICLVILLVTVPPLAVLPGLYFLGRILE